MLDEKTIEANLAKAKSDVTYWEGLLASVRDPRYKAMMLAVTGAVKIAERPQTLLTMYEEASKPQSYGSQKQMVFDCLPEYDSPGLTTAEIVTKMQDAGYRFSTKTPDVAVNEALGSLGGEVYLAGKRGRSNVWTRAAKVKTEATL